MNTQEIKTLIENDILPYLRIDVNNEIRKITQGKYNDEETAERKSIDLTLRNLSQTTLIELETAMYIGKALHQCQNANIITQIKATTDTAEMRKLLGITSDENYIEQIISESSFNLKNYFTAFINNY